MSKNTFRRQADGPVWYLVLFTAIVVLVDVALGFAVTRTVLQTTGNFVIAAGSAWLGIFGLLTVLGTQYLGLRKNRSKAARLYLASSLGLVVGLPSGVILFPYLYALVLVGAVL